MGLGEKATEDVAESIWGYFHAPYVELGKGEGRVCFFDESVGVGWRQGGRGMCLKGCRAGGPILVRSRWGVSYIE